MYRFNPAAESEDPVTLVVGCEQGDAQLVRQRPDAVLARPDPLPAELHDRAIREGVVEQASADPIARLEHHHRTTRGLKVAGGGQSRQARPDHDYLDLVHVVLPPAFA